MGMMCKLDCPWLSPYLFVSLGGWPFDIRVQPDLAVIRAYSRDPGGSPQPVIIVSAPPELEYGTFLQGYIAVLQRGIGHVSVRPSWMCVGAFPDGACHPAPLREIFDCFPDNIGPVTCPDLAPDLAPGFTCLPSDLITLFGVLSAYMGFKCVVCTTPITANLIGSRGIVQGGGFD